MKTKRKKTVFIFINLQYSVKYVLQTRLLDSFKKTFDQIVLITPNASDPEFSKLYADEKVYIEESNYSITNQFQKRRINRFFSNIRRYVYPEGCDLGTIKLKEQFLDHKSMSGRKKLFYSLILIIAKLMRKSRTIRNVVYTLELFFYPSSIHQSIYENYKPDLAVFQDLGTIERTNYQIYEAKQHNIPTAVMILSWDNLTAKGMGPMKPDYFSVWNKDLKDELIRFHEIKEDKISVDGNPVFDHHFGLDKTDIKKSETETVIFFASGSPGWHKDISKSLEVLLKANENELFFNKIKFVVRLHPIFFMKRSDDEFVKNEITSLNRLIDLYGQSLELVYPTLVSRKYGFEFIDKDIKEYVELLRDCDILLTNYSTMMLEAAIFDKPIVNIGYDFIRKAKIKSHEACPNETHLKNIFSYDFASVAKTELEAIDQINSYIRKPSIHREGRQRVREKYCGVNAGRASEVIVKNMYRNLIY